MASAIQSPAQLKKDEKKSTPPHDRMREGVETFVFVIVLVLLLKLFVTEAFVIPTGSMAETLYGYQQILTCPKCAHEFPVNSHDEVEPNQETGRYHKLVGYTCPNCRFQGRTDELPAETIPSWLRSASSIFKILGIVGLVVGIFRYSSKERFDSGTRNDAPPGGGTNISVTLISVGAVFVAASYGIVTMSSTDRNRTGDRVLVLKPIYHAQNPERGDVVVFKYPKKPQEGQRASNYIKRAQGFGGETIAIHRGDLYVTKSLEYPADALDEEGHPLYPLPEDPNDLWKLNYTYGDSPANRRALDLFEASRKTNFSGDLPGGFTIIRKPEKQILADRRIVWDNDQQPRELAEHNARTRWHDPLGTDANLWTNWSVDDPRIPKSFTHAKPDSLDFIRYRHLTRQWPMLGASEQPGPIDNFLGYNAGIDRDPMSGDERRRPNNNENKWVGDLILECQAEMSEGSEVVMELSKGQRRFQATFGGGKVVLSSTGPGGKELAARNCTVRGEGKFGLRFANVDSRLNVWVNDHLIDFGDEGDYPPGSTVAPDKSESEGYTEENDIAAPASIGAKGKATIRAIKLHRDIYYTRPSFNHSSADVFYVHPGHYLCLGDNSDQSSDSRSWGLVPERLLLGKAVFVFWPFSIDKEKNRIGFIK